MGLSTSTNLEPSAQSYSHFPLVSSAVPPSIDLAEDYSAASAGDGSLL